ncbi:MAG: hypothetical protein LBC44_04145 [Mycoplasmataceae bacterium]|jgi:hypothetical protein|nr:hypothetical protein [Mycoplasmataceae bacterium]
MGSKITKSALSILTAGTVSLSFATMFTMTSCSTVDVEILESVDEANAYLQNHTACLNKESLTVTQRHDFASDTEFQKFLAKNLSAQNIANALVQESMGFLEPNEDYTVKIFVEVSGEELSCSTHNYYVDEDGVPGETENAYEFTFTKGSVVDDIITLPKLNGKYYQKDNGEDTGEVLYTNEELNGASMGYLDKANVPGIIPGFYNQLVFHSLYFCLSGMITVSDGVPPTYTSTLDTKNVKFFQQS